MSLKSFNSEFPYIEIWFTGQKLKPLEMEDKICNRYTYNWFTKKKSKTAGTTGDLIGNKIADKITKVSKTSQHNNS